MLLRRLHGHLCVANVSPVVSSQPQQHSQQDDDDAHEQRHGEEERLDRLPDIVPVPYAPASTEQLLGRLRVPEAQRTPIYDQTRLDEIVASFDPVQFAADGYQVWPGIMLPEARARWVDALQSVQEQNDRMIMHDWEAVDWDKEVWHSGWTGALPAAANDSPGTAAVATGAPHWHHTRSGGSGLSEEMRSAMLGGGQLANPLFQGTGVGSHHMNELRVTAGQGFLPECFPPSHSPFLFDVITHPQHLGLHRLMLGQEIRFDHCTLLNRRPMFRGQGWHSHSYAEDGKVGSREAPELGLVRTIAYPDGFSASGDGGIRIVPGSHLFRATRIHPGGTTDDGVFRRQWLSDKKHPVTGEPLEIKRLSVPPGSLVSFLCNMPHAVDHRAKGRGTRWSCVCLSACLSVCLSVYLPACLPACLPCLPACLPRCVAIFFLVGNGGRSDSCR